MTHVREPVVVIHGAISLARIQVRRGIRSDWRLTNNHTLGCKYVLIIVFLQQQLMKENVLGKDDMLESISSEVLNFWSERNFAYAMTTAQIIVCLPNSYRSADGSWGTERSTLLFFAKSFFTHNFLFNRRDDVSCVSARRLLLVDMSRTSVLGKKKEESRNEKKLMFIIRWLDNQI